MMRFLLALLIVMAGPVGAVGGGRTAGSSAPISVTILSGLNEAHAFNAAGVVAGSAWNHAAIWKDGDVTDLGTLGGSASEATAIDDVGRVTGWAEAADGMPHAFLWQHGVMTDLGTFGFRLALPVDMANDGTIAANVQDDQGTWWGVLWREGVLTILQPLPATVTWSRVKAVNDAGTAVGDSLTTTWSATMWESGSALEAIRGLEGGEDSTAVAIDAAGTIAGWSQIPFEPGRPVARAVLWQNGRVTDLGFESWDVDLPRHQIALGEAGTIALTGRLPGVSPVCSWLLRDGKRFLLPSRSTDPCAETEVLDLNGAGHVLGRSGHQPVIWTVPPDASEASVAATPLALTTAPGITAERLYALDGRGLGASSPSLALSSDGRVAGTAVLGPQAGIVLGGGVSQPIRAGSGERVVVTDIEAGGIVVGWLEGTSGGTQAFSWLDGTSQLLKGAPDGSKAMAIDAEGAIAGARFDPGGASHAVLWIGGALLSMNEPDGAVESAAVALANESLVVGWWSDGIQQHGVMWQSGEPTDLGPFLPSDVNSWGEVAGVAIIDGQPEAAIWSDGSLRGLGVRTDPRHPPAINGLRQVLLTANVGPDLYRAQIWQNDALIELGMLPGASEFADQFGVDLNDNGQALGVYGDDVVLWRFDATTFTRGCGGTTAGVEWCANWPDDGRQAVASVSGAPLWPRSLLETDGTIIVPVGSPDAGVRAYDAETGELVWAAPLDGEWNTVGLATGPTVIALASGNAGAEVVALAPANGSVRWRYRTKHVVAQPITVSAGEVVLRVAGSDPGIVLLDARDGSVQWRVGTTAAPGPVAMVEDMLVAGLADGSVVAVDRNDGALRWQIVPTGQPAEWSGWTATAAVEGTHVYFSATYGVMRPGGWLLAIDATSSNEVWHLLLPRPVTAPAVDDGRFFVGDSSGAASAFDTATGQALWQWRPSGNVPPVAYGGMAPVVTRGVVLLSGPRIENGRFVSRIDGLDAGTGDRVMFLDATDGLLDTPPLAAGLHVFVSGTTNAIEGFLCSYDLPPSRPSAPYA